MLKNKNKGFTMIELLVAITIMGALASMSAPELGRMLQDNRYQTDIEHAWSIVNDARANALSSRRCPQGVEAGIWKVVVNASSARLVCISDGASENEQEVSRLEPLSGTILNVTSGGSISFLPQTAQVKLDAGNDFSFQIKNIDLRKCAEIKINRVAGFPEKNMRCGI